MLTKEFSNKTPIYLQIIEEIKMKIISGEYKLGEKIPSVRDLSENIGVNPNTMQRALAELERQNLVFAERTAGRFITSDGNLVEKTREDLAEEAVKRFLASIKNYGFSTDEIIEKIKKESEGES